MLIHAWNESFWRQIFSKMWTARFELPGTNFHIYLSASGWYVEWINECFRFLFIIQLKHIEQDFQYYFAYVLGNSNIFSIVFYQIVFFCRIILSEFPGSNIPKLNPYAAPNPLVVDSTHFSVLKPKIHWSNFTVFGFENAVVKEIRYYRIYMSYNHTKIVQNIKI